MKKICRTVFSRYAVSALAIAVELALIFYLLFEAYEYSAYALIFIIAVNVGVMVTIVNRNANPEYKVSWLVVVLLLPPFGAVLYAIFYSRRISKKQARFMKRVFQNLHIPPGAEGQGCVEIHDRVYRDLSESSALATGKAYAIMNDDPTAALYRGSSSRLYSRGEEMYTDMLADLSEAKKYIFLEYFIIEEGEMWQGILDILKTKAQQGVEVRVLYDDIGCMKTLPARYDRTLGAMGISCLRFSPATPTVTVAHNHRDHRKILIVDGKVAYTGGVNIADEYINLKKRFGYWKDGGVRICGTAVEGFLKLFLFSWDLTATGISDTKKYLSEVREVEDADGGYYLPFGSGPTPIYSRPVGKNAILNIVNQSEKYVYITTPYLIIDYDLTESLRNAALRGVDVRIITPGVADKKLVKIMTKSSYPHLIEAGVRIYEFQPGFMHEKCIVSDDLYAILGTINLDFRSLAHHFEDAVWIYSSPTVIAAREEFFNSMSVSDERSAENSRLNIFEWVVRSLTRIFAPLL